MNEWVGGDEADVVGGGWGVRAVGVYSAGAGVVRGTFASFLPRIVSFIHSAEGWASVVRCRVGCRDDYD